MDGTQTAEVGASTGCRAGRVLSPGLCAMTRACLLHAGWAAEAWGPVTPPKPGSAWCTGVQARSFIPEENRSWCPPGGPPEPGPRAPGWVQHFFPHLGTLKRLPARSQTDSVTHGGREARPGLAEGLRGQRRGTGGQGSWAKATAARSSATAGHWAGQCPQGRRPGQALLPRRTGSPAEIRAQQASLASLAAISGPAWGLIGGRPHGGWPLAAYRPIAAHCADIPICGG